MTTPNLSAGTGFIHITFQDNNGYGLAYAQGKPGSWIQRSLKSSALDGYETRIICDGKGKQHILHTDGDTNIYYTNNAVSTWQNSIFYAAAGWKPALTVNSEGKIFAIVQAPWTPSLVFVTNSSGSVASEVIGSLSSSLYRTFIALDSTGKVHAVTKVSSSLVHFKGSLGAFTSDTIGPSEGEMAGIMDNSDELHLVHRVNDDMIYAHGNASFSSETINTGTKPGKISMALDSEKKVHAAYINDNTHELFHVTNQTGAWVATKIDTNLQGYINSTTISLTSDENNSIYIVYYDQTAEKIKLANNASGTWQKEDVASSRGHAFHCLTKQ